MAEGFARAWGLQAASAGLEPSRVRPQALRTMAEKGIDISGQTSKALSDELVEKADVVITLCADAAERCLVFPPTVRVLHWPLPDPAKATGSEADILQVFRSVRDQIEAQLRGFLHGAASAEV
ncbi:MAG: arsenate reductase ArsC [Candidatus Rokubacteria bacterium]|nr:arsenate reductase ArsC [Candidatus Rokubacteria bacterium]